MARHLLNWILVDKVSYIKAYNATPSLLWNELINHSVMLREVWCGASRPNLAVKSFYDPSYVKVSRLLAGLDYLCILLGDKIPRKPEKISKGSPYHGITIFQAGQGVKFAFKLIGNVRNPVRKRQKWWVSAIEEGNWGEFIATGCISLRIGQKERSDLPLGRSHTLSSILIFSI